MDHGPMLRPCLSMNGMRYRQKGKRSCSSAAAVNIRKSVAKAGYGVQELVLLTDSPKTTYLGLDAYGLTIVGTKPILKDA